MSDYKSLIFVIILSLLFILIFILIDINFINSTTTPTSKYSNSKISNNITPKDYTYPFPEWLTYTDKQNSVKFEYPAALTPLDDQITKTDKDIDIKSRTNFLVTQSNSFDSSNQNSTNNSGFINELALQYVTYNYSSLRELVAYLNSPLTTTLNHGSNIHYVNINGKEIETALVNLDGKGNTEIAYIFPIKQSKVAVLYFPILSTLLPHVQNLTDQVVNTLSY